MKKLKIIIQAFTGYAGSSESPEKVSARFMGIAMGIASQFAPLLASLFGVNAEVFVTQAQPIILLVAVIMWAYGAIKAMWTAVKQSPTLGGFLRQSTGRNDE